MIDAERARRIGLVILDADGVLTDGGIYVADGQQGRPFQLRRFHVRDGMALHLLRHAGIDIAIVSGRDSPAVRERARELWIDEVHQVSPYEKVPRVERLLEARGLSWDELAFLADDLADLAVLERAGLPAAVGDAVPEIRERAEWIGERPGGEAAVREFVEALLRARGEWEEMVERYADRSRHGGGGPGGGDGEGAGG